MIQLIISTIRLLIKWKYIIINGLINITIRKNIGNIKVRS